MRAARGPQVKNAGRANLFNPLTRISPPRISPQPVRVSSGVERAGPLTRKKKNVIVLMCADDREDYNYKKLMKVFLRQHPMLLKWKNVNNVYV